MIPSITLRGEIYSLHRPKVMGIINATPDSFFPGSRTPDASSIRMRVKEMLKEGVDIIDVGGYSSRPGAEDVSEQVEFDRLAVALDVIKDETPGIPVSVDTFRASVAEKVIKGWNVDIINDISGGSLDPEIGSVVAENKKAYILMHMRGTPATMNSLTEYASLPADIISDLAFKMAALRETGLANILVDPGFGFAKTLEQNFLLLDRLKDFQILNAPILVGISRKTMIWKTLTITPEEALNGTTVLNTVALMNGANILRVHDVREARESITLFNALDSIH